MLLGLTLLVWTFEAEHGAVLGDVLNVFVVGELNVLALTLVWTFELDCLY